jgi:hypothetical protein
MFLKCFSLNVYQGSIFTMKTTILAAAIALGAAACSTSNQSVEVPRSAQLACSQLPADAPQLVSQVLTPGATYGARAISETRVIARAHQPQVVVGAEVALPAPEGVTKEYLQRVLTCHADTGVAAHSADPFHPSSGSVREIAIRSSGAALAIQIRGDNSDANREILSRAHALTTPAADVTVEQVGQAAAVSPL